MSVHGTAICPPLLSPAGFPRVIICSYRNSFGSLGNFPFCLPSDFSLSTTLLHTPTHATKPSLLSPSCLIPPHGTYPDELPQVLSGTVFASHPPKTLSQTQYSVPDWTMPGTSPSLLHSQVLSSERPRKCNNVWWNTHTKRITSIRPWEMVLCRDGSPNRSLFQWCLYCYQKNSLQQWAEGVVHLTNTRHQGYSVCSWLFCLEKNHFYKIKLDLTSGACCCCFYGTSVEWYLSKALDYCGKATQKSGEGLGYKK